jgi:hypothetical protein
MFGVEQFSGNVQAAVLVGIVLVEAALLYVGYGGIERVAAPKIRSMLEG